MTTVPAKSQPGMPWAALVCALAGVAVLQFFGNASRGYIHTSSLFYWWFSQWLDPRAETQHGWLVLGLSVWLGWRNLRAESGESRVESRELRGEIRSPKLALAAMVGGLVLHLLGYFVQQTRISIVALLLFAWGGLVLAGGRRWGRAAAFPLVFLLFAVPVDFLDSAGFWLRQGVLDASSALAHAAGIAVVRSGNLLFAPDGRFQYDVAVACSGVRSLMALLALSLLAGYLHFRAWGLRGAMLLLALPFAYVGNVVRISAVIFAAQWLGPRAGVWMHEWGGFLVFAVVLGLMLATIATIKRFWPQTAADETVATESPREPVRNVEGASRVAAVVVVFAVAVAWGAHWLDTRPMPPRAGVRLATDGVNPAEWPTFLGDAWIGRRVEVTAVEREILPADTGFSRRLYLSRDNPNRAVLLSTVLSGRDRSSIHRPELCLVGQGWTIDEVRRHRFVRPGSTAAEIPATILRVHRDAPGPGGRHAVVPAVVAYWFVGGDTIVATHGQRLWQDALARLRGRADRWAYVLAQTEASDGEAAALARIQSVLGAAWPTLQESPPHS
jgi:exosortase